jgi:integrase
MEQTFASRSIITIEAAAESWLAHLQTRRRRPIKPASAKTFRSYLDAHVLPRLGQLEVGSVGVAVLRQFVADLDAAGLSAKSQVEITSCVKSIIASVCDAEGEPLYPRKWDNERLDLPLVNPAEQRQPTVTAVQIETAIANAPRDHGALYALLGGSGLRIGEAFALRIGPSVGVSFWNPTDATLIVKTSVWRGAEQTPKTASAARTVELAEPLNNMLREFTGSRTGFLFGNGKPISYSAAREQLAKHDVHGFHAFRRFRATTLLAARVPSVLTKYWLGHSNHGDITEHYANGGMTNDVQLRREWADKVGLAFSCSRQV